MGKGYVRNTVKGKQRGKPYSEGMKTLALTELLTEDIHAVAKKHRIPESTLRGWVKKAREIKDKETGKSVWDTQREAAIRAVSAKAAVGAEMAVNGALESLKENENSRAKRAEIIERLQQEDVSEEEREKLMMILKLIPRMEDGSINGYIRTLTTTVERAAKQLGEDTVSEVTVVMSEEAEQYAR